MRCLYAGAFGKHCSDIYRLQGMAQAGWQVRAIDFRKTWAERKENGLINDIVHLAKSEEADFILINKGEKFTGSALRTIKSLTNLPIFLFYGDKRTSWPQDIVDKLPFVDVFLINSDDKEEKKRLVELGAKKVVYHHTATDANTFKKHSDTDEICDVIFFGSNYNNLFPKSIVRRDYIRRLLTEKDIKTRIHGHGWDDDAKPVVFGSDFARIASSAKIILGFNAFDNINKYTSNRTFNCMACGMYLSATWKGCKSMFEEGKEIEYFTSYKQMVSKIREYKEDAESRKNIYQAGLAKIIKEHTYRIRAIELERIFEEEIRHG